MSTLLEVTLSWLFANAKGRDAKSFYTKPALLPFKDAQTIEVTSPEFPEAGLAREGQGARLKKEHSADGEGRLPTLTFKASTPELAAKVKQWLVVIEDPDVPLPTPIAHAVFTGIPPSKTTLEHRADLPIQDGSRALLKGGFHYGKTLRGVPYVPPRPLLNHGPHRYFYQVVALGEELDEGFVGGKPTREQVADAIVGKVLGWGMWIGSYERKWE